jgi:SAM-dependent methyltransferase
LRGLSDQQLRQQRYFDVTRHQYPRSSLLEPPLHTELETERILRVLPKLRPEGQIVDLGAGTGRLSIALARAGYAVLAVDISRASLDVLTGVARELRLDAIETADAIPSGTFPAVVGADVLHHVDLDDYIPRIHAALRPGGKAIFSEPGALNPFWYAYLPLFHDIRVETRLVTCNIPNLRRRFRRHGFREITITGVGVLPRAFFNWSTRACRLHDAAGNWPAVRWFAYRYIIDATK